MFIHLSHDGVTLSWRLWHFHSKYNTSLHQLMRFAVTGAFQSTFSVILNVTCSSLNAYSQYNSIIPCKLKISICKVK